MIPEQSRFIMERTVSGPVSGVRFERTLPSPRAGVMGKMSSGAQCSKPIDLFGNGPSTISFLARVAAPITGLDNSGGKFNAGFGITSVGSVVSGYFGYGNAKSAYETAKTVNDVAGMEFAKMDMAKSAVEVGTGVVIAGVRTLTLTGLETANKTGKVAASVLGNIATVGFGALYLFQFVRSIKELLPVISFSNMLDKRGIEDRYTFLEAHAWLANGAEYRKNFGANSLSLTMIKEGKSAGDVVAQAKKDIAAVKRKHYLMLFATAIAITGFVLTTIFSGGTVFVAGVVMMLTVTLITSALDTKKMVENFKKFRGPIPLKERRVMAIHLALTIASVAAGVVFAGGGAMLTLAVAVGSMMIGAQTGGMLYLWKKSVTENESYVNLPHYDLKTRELSYIPSL